MYQFPPDARKALEAMPLPIAYYQKDGDRIVAILVSDGLCKMMGAERDKLINHLNSGLLDRVHPDDAGRIARIIREFSNHLCGYDVIYRGKYSQNDDYHYIHSIGHFQTAPDGTELAIFAYTDMSDSQSESNMLVENYTLFQKDQFYSDSVTGLPNINYVHEFADEKVNKIRACGHPVALIYFDIRGLRSYNNQYGVQEGDELLRLVAASLKGEFPDGLLVRGATCALGYAAVQLAKALGATVIATTHKREKLPLLEGADIALLDDGTLVGRAELADVHKALDLVGPRVLRDTLRAIAPEGFVCHTGVLGGQYVLDDFDPIKDIPNGVYLTGFYSNTPSPAVIQDIFAFLAQHDLHPRIGASYDFAHIQDACVALDEGKVNGKIVVTVSEGL